MLIAGREFDDGSFCWDDLYAFIFASPPGTAVFHALEKGWSTTDYLLAHVIDGIRINNWQRTEGATKKPPRNIPDPFPRPADDKKDGAVGDVAVVGDTTATVTTVEDFVAQRQARQQRWLEKHRGGGS